MVECGRDERISLACAKPEQHSEVTEGQIVGKVGVPPARK